MRVEIPAYIKKSIINVDDSNSGAYACIINLMKATIYSVWRVSVT